VFGSASGEAWVYNTTRCGPNGRGVRLEEGKERVFFFGEYGQVSSLLILDECPCVATVFFKSNFCTNSIGSINVIFTQNSVELL
jgi:hypothetical protein